MVDFNLEFYKNKRVLITGHTGFKGAWMCKVLTSAGAIVTGYALNPPTEPSLFKEAGIEKDVTSVIGDIRDLSRLKETFEKFQPEIVIHLAAQPIVRESYVSPLYTYDTNVMGTVNVLECVRENYMNSKSIRSFLNITTDKVYLNKEWHWGYRENDPLDGYDPYSNSKSCSELVTHSYRKSFFYGVDAPAISTARAGNVIGGGDFAKDRIIPDCVRAACKGEKIIVRNPYSTRPYQHVLESIMAYLLIAAKQYESKQYEGEYNVGPDDSDCYETGRLVEMFVNKWGNNIKWEKKTDCGNELHEASFLKLDCSKIKNVFSWRPTWNLEKAIDEVVQWSKCWIKGEDIRSCMDNQINRFIEDRK